MISRDEIVEIGHYAKPHGVNGEITAIIDCDLEVINCFSCLISDVDAIFVPFFVEKLRRKSAHAVLLIIDGINSEVDAALLVNKKIYVLKTEFDNLDQEINADGFPMDYFIGFHVYNQGRELGTIVDVDDSTANVLFKVACVDSGNSLLIPAVDDLIDDIETSEMRIYMSLPEELLELN